MNQRAPFVGALAVLALSTPLLAQEAKRVAVATLASETGSVMRREAAGKPWQTVAQKEKISTIDVLLGFPGAEIDTPNGAVRITFISDLDASSPYPIVETAVVLHEPTGVDADLTLDRGRVDLENRKENGTAKVRVRVRKETWDLTLDKGANVAVELYGRWPAGTHFNKEPNAKESPTANLVFLVTDGHASIKHGAFEYAMSAPPDRR